MEYYDNPYYAENLRLKPWFTLTDEERSYVLYNGYKRRVFKSEEVSDYLRTVRLSNISQVLFPVVAYPVLKHTVFRAMGATLYYKMPHAQSIGARALILIGSWVAWLTFNPLYKKALNDKEDLLKQLHTRIGYNLLDLNDVLPRWKTCAMIHNDMQTLYNERTSMFAGYLYPNEESAEPLVDLSSWPKRIKSKISK